MTYISSGKEILFEHRDTKARTHIADAGDAEKAHFLATMANAPKGEDGGPFDYMAEADKTCSIVFNPQFVSRTEVLNILSNVIGFAEDMNMLKKLFFRGRTPQDLNMPMPSDDDSMGPLLKGCTDDEVNIIHGIVGVITEAGEMAELLKAFFEGTPFDRVHLLEEGGDVEWYQVRILRGIHASLYQRDFTNINKLHGRHGSAFDVFRDANRDLGAERKQLEADAAPVPLFEEAAAIPSPAAVPPRQCNDPPLPIGAASTPVGKPD